MDKEDVKAIAIAAAIAPVLVFALWWCINLVALVAGGYAAPMWSDFNSWLLGIFI